MQEHTSGGHYSGSVAIDVCHSCRSIWFDKQELLELTPAATLDLLAVLADVKDAERRPLGDRMNCPRCGLRLLETHDQRLNTRFWYHRCPRGHGRLVTFFQFLRAKNVVRPLGDAEIAELRRHIRQVNCANCGAPVDVEKDGICAFCRTPLAMLDADQVKRLAAEVRREVEKAAAGPDPTLPLALALERRRAERAFADAAGADGQPGLAELLLGADGDPLGTAMRILKGLLG